MGTISCYQPQPINPATQQILPPQQQDSKIQAGIDYINLLTHQLQNKFFLDFKPSQGIQTFIGINVQNLSSLHQFIKQIKLKDHQSSFAKVTDSRKLLYQNTLNTECQTIVDQVKTALFELKKNTKKHVKALSLNQSRNNTNFVNTPYYLPWIQTQNRHVCVYIGEWKFQSRYLMKNFPCGIGRLYINDEVWEGEIQPSIDNFQQLNLSTVQSLQATLTNSQTPTKQKINLIKHHLTLHLHGAGRKFTKDQQYSGHFEKGLLHGKGEYKNFKHQYSYQGSWLDNAKCGKGIQRTKASKYEGAWKNNKKNGQGTLIFYISPQQEKQRQREQKIFDELNQNHTQYKHRKARVTIQMTLEELADKQLRQTLASSLQKYKGEQLLTFQHLHYTPWEIQGFPFVNKTYVENLKFQQMMKTNFCEKYVGQFVNDQFHGKGMYQWLKGNFYVGDWVNGKMEGRGKFYWKEGYVYYGEYKNDLKHGRGEMKWDPYKRHRGNWAFGKKHGYGEEIKIQLNEQNELQVTIISGLWKNNTLDPKDTYFSKRLPILPTPNHASYLGILKHNYHFYHPDAKLTQSKKFNIIQDEARNYFRNPCSYCGSYIRKEEKQESRTYLEEVFRMREGKEPEEHKGKEEGQEPEVCNNCLQKLKELEEVSKDKQQPQKLEELKEKA